MSLLPKKFTPNPNVPPIISGSRRFDDGNVQLWHGDARRMDFIPDNSVELIVTSPPYNVMIQYMDGKKPAWNDAMPVDKYLEFTKQWLTEAYRVLCRGGRICVNVPSACLQSTGSRDAFVAMDVWNIAVKDVGFLPREWITWKKPQALSGVTSWGSWQSPSCPFIRDTAEFILVFSKETHKLEANGRKTDLTREEFMRLTSNVWTMVASNHNNGHPATFPIELPLRCIKLYTYIGDTVLDPFSGSGTTPLAAKMLNRKGIGVDISLRYIEESTILLGQNFLFDGNVVLTKYLSMDNEDNLVSNQLKLIE